MRINILETYYSHYMSDTPFGQVPVLFIEDKPLPQSASIVRYLAREFNLAGESSLEQAYVDMVAETLRDTATGLPFMEENPEKKVGVPINVMTCCLKEN